MTRLYQPAAALAFSLLLALSCTNNSPSEDTKDQAREINDETLPREQEQDADRMVELADLNEFEVQASKDALGRASTDEVKKVAQMMVDAHSRMSGEMKQLADSKGVSLPTDITNNRMNDLEELSKKTGLDYDKEYLDLMERAHDEALRKLENTSNRTSDADVRNFANKAIPEIRSHLDMVEATKNNVKDLKQDTRTASKTAR